MANKTPKNDFAPAWLKIPSADSSKPHGNRASEQSDNKSRPNRRDDYYYNRYPGPPPPNYPYQPLQRQRSFDNYYEDRRYPPQKFRHHSVDDDFYHPIFGDFPPYYNNYDCDNYGNHYRSQPSLYRDGKYQHPNSRYNSPQMNGGYPYYDNYYDYYGDQPYYPGYMSRPPPGSKRLYQGDRERNPSKPDRDKNGDSKTKDVTGEEDFPSLNGDDTPDKTKVQNTSGVWEKQPGSKLLNNGHVSSPDGKNTDAKGTSNMYKALIPQKGTFKKLHSQVGCSPIKLGSTKLNGSMAESNSTATNSTSSGPIEILNSHLKSPPKKIGDTKSGFLRQLKGSDTGVNGFNMNGTHEHSENGEDTLCNGVKALSVSPSEDMLSSSLEAEQRLLREMGWNEADEEEYVITEDDKKAFQSLSKQLKEKRNGLTRTLPKTWSPTHLATFQTPVPVLNDSLSSSSDDDSDADLP